MIWKPPPENKWAVLTLIKPRLADVFASTDKVEQKAKETPADAKSDPLLQHARNFLSYNIYLNFFPGIL